jgi:hypothetical protein
VTGVARACEVWRQTQTHIRIGKWQPFSWLDWRWRRDDSEEGHGIIPFQWDSDCLQMGWAVGASIDPSPCVPSHLTPDGACTAPVKIVEGGENERKWGRMDRLSLTCNHPPSLS